MYNIDSIKKHIKRLCETNPNIHISVKLTRPKAVAIDTPARIIGVYNNIFQIEECGDSKPPARHTFQYGEVLIGKVVIKELDYVPVSSKPIRK